MNKIISSYYEYAPFGFGDFLRGSLVLKELCDLENIDFTVDFSKHEISDYIKFKKPCEDYKNEDVAFITMSHVKLIEYIKKNINNKSLQICTNAFPNYIQDAKYNINKTLFAFESQIKESTKKFFRDNIEFSDLIIKESQNRLSKIGLDEYHILHFRVGDDHAFTLDSIPKKARGGYRSPIIKNNSFEFIFNSFYEKQDRNKKFLIYCNCEKVKKAILRIIKKRKIDNFFIISGKASHTSKHMLEEAYRTPIHNGFFETFLDLYNITQSKSVYSFSVYPFFSNFTKWMCSIYDVEHHTYNVQSYIDEK